MLAESMTLVEAAVLAGTALLGGALNSVAGGGSFLTFPALIVTGVPPVQANATSTAALWPGSLMSVAAYRRELRGRRGLALLAGTSVAGGVLGALLLLRTPQAVFVQLVPYLLLAATLLFAFGGALTRHVRQRFRLHVVDSPDMPAAMLAGVALLQLAIATYGGYFGGGIGILMLAALALLGMDDLHAMNALKTLMASCINGVAVLTFVLAGAVAWPQALLMLGAAMAGGYGGAHYARKMDQRLVRRFVIAVGFAMTAYFFLRR
jgi:uncharacterized membrane protein YfcA